MAVPSAARCFRMSRNMRIPAIRLPCSLEQFYSSRDSVPKQEKL